MRLKLAYEYDPYFSLSMVRDETIEKLAVAKVKEYEEARGWKVESVEKENRGFDLISRKPHPHDNKTFIEVRFIKVKGRATIGEIALTSNEYKTAERLQKDYWLYVVYNCASNPEIHTIQDPDLIKEIRNSKSGFSYKRFRDITEFTRLVYASLIEFLKENSIVGRGGFDERICEDATFVDIDEEKVRWFVRVARDTRKFSLAVNTPVKDVLTHLNLLRKNKLTLEQKNIFQKVGTTGRGTYYVLRGANGAKGAEKGR